jgi:hypothetical protein
MAAHVKGEEGAGHARAAGGPNPASNSRYSLVRFSEGRLAPGNGSFSIGCLSRDLHKRPRRLISRLDRCKDRHGPANRRGAAFAQQFRQRILDREFKDAAQQNLAQLVPL